MRRAPISNGRMFCYLLISIVMSGYDAVATMQHIARGIAAEGNPLMDSLIEFNAAAFFAVKMLITASCLSLCYGFAHLRGARLGLRVAVVIYSVISVYHAAISLFV